MSNTFPASGYLSNAGRTVAEEKQGFEDFLAATKTLPGGVAQTTLTINAGSITPTLAVHAVDTEAGAATDDLTNAAVTNLDDGRLLLLQCVNAAHFVVVKHAAGGSGQFSLAGAADLTLKDPSAWLLLKRTGTTWTEIGRFYGTQKADARVFAGVPGLADANAFSARQLWAKGADLASSATLTLGTDGNYFKVTGTTTVTGIASLQAGTRVLLEFTGILILTHNASSFILQGGVNATTAAGDVFEFVSLGSGNWKEVNRSSVATSSGGGFWADPESAFMFWEDFNAASAYVANTTYTSAQNGSWLLAGLETLADQGALNGVVRIGGKTTPSGFGWVGIGIAAVRALTNKAKQPTLYVRWAQYGTGLGTRFVGLGCGSGNLNNDGIYFRHTNAGTITAVCRSGGSESTLSTGVAAANGAFHSGRLVVGASVVTVYLDNVLIGTIGTNIPTGNLGVGVDLSDNTNVGDGVDLDSVAIRALR